MAAMKCIYLVAGARPNFMKIAPIVRALQVHGGLAFKIIHTGQHYDREMNDVFFEELGIPQPDIFMAAGGGLVVKNIDGPHESAANGPQLEISHLSGIPAMSPGSP